MAIVSHHCPYHDDDDADDDDDDDDAYASAYAYAAADDDDDATECDDKGSKKALNTFKPWRRRFAFIMRAFGSSTPPGNHP